MLREKHDIVIIGGGPAGLAAAVAAREEGCRDVVIIERNNKLGGILNQCIHDGFGLHKFKKSLTGPEYAERYIKKVKSYGITAMENTMVLNLSANKVLRISSNGEIKEIEAKAVILAMGCRERTRGAISIPGHRPAGVYTAGMAQKLMNEENFIPGKKVCILGSGDIGLIMARRLTIEGIKVTAVFEIMHQSSGLERNIEQCLIDYNIPLFLNTTIIDINGPNGCLEGITVATVNPLLKPIAGTERYIECDTLLLSVGLIPENELSREAGLEIDSMTRGPVSDHTCKTSVNGIFACGNVLHVHDLVDNVSLESATAGVNAFRYLTGKKPIFCPELITNNRTQVPEESRTCILCPNSCVISINNYSGCGCNKGRRWIEQELSNPKRNFSSSILVEHGDSPLVSVRTTKPVPLAKIFDIMKLIKIVSVQAPLKSGQVLLRNPADIDTNIIATKSVAKLA